MTDRAAILSNLPRIGKFKSPPRNQNMPISSPPKKAEPKTVSSSSTNLNKKEVVKLPLSSLRNKDNKDNKDNQGENLLSEEKDSLKNKSSIDNSSKLNSSKDNSSINNSSIDNSSKDSKSDKVTVKFSDKS